MARSHCGGLNETPCKVWERVPSCDSGLVEDFAKGKCVAKAKPISCGQEGQRPCLVTERIPSCAPNLIEKGGRCVHPQCGRPGDRPCTLAERVPSCDQGLTEDRAKKLCLNSDPKVATCQMAVTAIRSSKPPAEVTAALSSKIKQQQSERENALRSDATSRNRLLSQIATDLEPYTYAVPELKRIARWLNTPANRSKLDSLFNAESFCQDSIATMDKKLRQLGLAPTFSTVRTVSAEPPHFYMGYQITLGISQSATVNSVPLPGFQVGLMGVTDFRGRGGKYWFFGLQIVTNASADLMGEVTFYPKVTLEDFPGFGWGLGVSGGPPTKVVQGGVDVMLDDAFSRVQGFGFGPGIGVGVLPADVAVSFSHAWKY
jgi:hypothetical protein